MKLGMPKKKCAGNRSNVILFRKVGYNNALLVDHAKIEIKV